ncbi:MAG: hypothetical protein A3K22_02505 [Deltaproteobacteria bacterium RBG_16_42_7]|nr:MAG: hypothetical protein A3K22_02505 [Deltaproteobacteria bacterium RBG_16_42_7]
MKKRFYLTYPPELIKEPLIYQVIKSYEVVVSIRQANISDKLGLMALELEGEAAEIDKAVQFLSGKGVTVEPIELDVIE